MGLLNNPYIMMGANILAAGGPGVSSSQALGRGLLGGMQSLYAMREYERQQQAQQTQQAQ